MAHDGTRGTLYNPVGVGTQFDMGRVIDDDNSFKAGIIKVSIPFLKSSGAVGDSVLGKVRVLSVRGVKHGTQLEIEAFIKQFDDHTNVNGFQDSLRYYPIFHSANTAGEGSQNGYYTVLINDFSHRASERNGGFVLQYDLELFEMNSVIEALTAS